MLTGKEAKMAFYAQAKVKVFGSKKYKSSRDDGSTR